MAAPDFARRVWDAMSCAPICTEGALLTTIRSRLLAQVMALGFTLQAEPELRLLVGGRSLEPSWSGPTAMFHLPPGTTGARLHSHRFRPAEITPESADTRRLGVAVGGLGLDGVGLALDHPGLVDGWQAREPDLRWTDGAAAIACDGAEVLEVALAPLGRYWHAGATARVAAA